jgi:protein-disulfide isomerase
MPSIRILIAAAMALSLTACSKTPSAVTTDDMVLGNATAPVTVIEYASVACPVCAVFNNDTFPAFKTKYVDTGQVRYVFREILAHDPRLAAAGFLLARCAGPDNYFKVTDAIFHDQDRIEGDIAGGLASVAKGVGLTQKQLDACLADTKAIDALNARNDKYSKDDHITGTPTFDINGVRIESLPSMADLDSAIAAAKAKKS